jgi:NADH-quinone oxidoreductase subunit N
VLAGLSRRSPLLALGLTVGVISLAGVPPLAGFFGKLLLFKAILERAGADQTYLWLALIAIAGVVISYYYYFGIIRAVYWSEQGPDMSPIAVSVPMKICTGVCIVAILYLGIFPNAVLSAASDAVKVLRF